MRRRDLPPQRTSPSYNYAPRRLRICDISVWIAAVVMGTEGIGLVFRAIRRALIRPTFIEGLVQRHPATPRSKNAHTRTFRVTIRRGNFYCAGKKWGGIGRPVQDLWPNDDRKARRRPRQLGRIITISAYIPLLTDRRALTKPKIVGVGGTRSPSLKTSLDANGVLVILCRCSIWKVRGDDRSGNHGVGGN